ncbi:protein FAM161A-like [Esox lucius]|uniref:protein FAM161A-like n=1 Tax=Esox lucius TaxID=8010 RepID=UPI0014773DA8|nr:protein FAM161A-like [Esox lucius]
MRRQRENDSDVRAAVRETGLSRKNKDIDGIYRSPSLRSNELLALYGPEPVSYGGRHLRQGREDEEFDNADSEDRQDNMKQSLSLEEGYGVEREPCSGLRRVYFSNQEYYQRLEDLKRAHLRNMADLEKMYICQSVTSKSCGPLPGRRLQRILSDEELNFHDETSSGMSDHSESGVSQEEEDNHYELVLDHSEEDRPTPGSCTRKEKPLRNSPREDTPPCRLKATSSTTSTAAHKQPSATASSRSQVHIELQMRSCCPERGSLDGGPGKTGCRTRDKNCCGLGGRNYSRGTATVPQPFKMMVREEEKKRRKVRTRSDVELENSVLRRELDELRECGVKFRASPAPAHTRLPLCAVIGRRPGRPLGNRVGNQYDRHVSGRCSYLHVRDDNRCAGSCSPPRPFSFLERERRRRERRIEAELGNQAPREEKRVFKARPVPRSVYCSNSATRRPQRTTQKVTQETGQRSTGRPPGSRAEGPGDDRGGREEGEDHGRPRLEAEEVGGVSTIQVPFHSNSCWRPEVKGRRRPSVKQLKLQIEMESETRKGREWSYIDPLLTRTNSHSFCTPLLRQEGLPLPASKGDYISVCKSRDRTIESVS